MQNGQGSRARAVKRASRNKRIKASMFGSKKRGRPAGAALAMIGMGVGSGSSSEGQRFVRQVQRNNIGKTMRSKILDTKHRHRIAKKLSR